MFFVINMYVLRALGAVLKQSKVWKTATTTTKKRDKEKKKRYKDVHKTSIHTHYCEFLYEMPVKDNVGKVFCFFFIIFSSA